MEQNEKEAVRQRVRSNNDEIADLNREVRLLRIEARSLRRTRDFVEFRGVQLPLEAWKTVYEYVTEDKALDPEFYRRMSRTGISRSDASALFRAQKFSPYELRFVTEGATEDAVRLEEEVERLTEQLSRLETDNTAGDTQIREINVELRLKEEAQRQMRRFKYIEYEFVKFFVYDEPGGTAHRESPKVRFEVRATLTVPRGTDVFNSSYLDRVLEKLFDEALESWGSKRTEAARQEIYLPDFLEYQRGRRPLPSGARVEQRGGRYYRVGRPVTQRRAFINVARFRGDFQTGQFTRGIEQGGMTDTFNSSPEFEIVKYNLRTGTTETFPSFRKSVTVREVSP